MQLRLACLGIVGGARQSLFLDAGNEADDLTDCCRKWS